MICSILSKIIKINLLKLSYSFVRGLSFCFRSAFAPSISKDLIIKMSKKIGCTFLLLSHEAYLLVFQKYFFEQLIFFPHELSFIRLLSFTQCLMQKHLFISLQFCFSFLPYRLFNGLFVFVLRCEFMALLGEPLMVFLQLLNKLGLNRDSLNHGKVLFHCLCKEILYFLE